MEIYILIVASLITLSSSQQLQEKKCRGVYFSDKYYDIEILKDGVNRLQKLILNRNDNTLYFIFEVDYLNTAAGYLDINTRIAGVIQGIRNATSIAIDQQFNKLYVGGKDGIFRINPNKSPEKLPVYDSIQDMYFKDVLFYTNSINEAFVYDNGHIDSVFELQYVRPQKIVLDDDHNIFFTEGNNLFRVRLGTRVVNSHESYKINVLTTDADDRPYIVTKDGIYVYNKYKYVFDKVSALTDLKALTFNKFGEPIYCVADYIIRLNQNPVKCFETLV